MVNNRVNECITNLRMIFKPKSDLHDTNSLKTWIVHFGTEVHQAPTPNQSVLSVVYRKAPQELLISEYSKC